MLICYIHQLAKMDVEIAFVLNKRPILKPEPEPKELHKFNLGKIRKDNWCVVYQRKENQKFMRNMFFLRDKHLYSNASLNSILELTEACKPNNIADKKSFSDFIQWYLVVRITLLNLMTILFKVKKRQY